MSFADLSAQMAKGMVGWGKISKGMQSTALIATGLEKILGKKLLNTIVKVKQVFELWTEIMGPAEEGIEAVGDAVEVAVSPLTIFVVIMKAMMVTIIFLIGLFAAVGAALIYFGGSVEGATGIFPDFFAGLESIKGSLMEIGGHLSGVTSGIGEMNWTPMVEMAKIAVFAIVMFFMNFAVAAVDAWADIFNIAAEFFDYLNDSGLLSVISDAFSNLMLAGGLIFYYLFELLDVFGVNWSNTFGLVTSIIGGLVTFLIDSGLTEFFIKLSGVVIALLPILVVVVGEGLLLFAKLIALVGGPLLAIFMWAFGLIVNIITFAFKIIFFFINAFLDLFLWALNGIISFIKGEWTIKEAIGDIVASIVEVVTDLVNGFLELLGKIPDVLGDALEGVSNLLSSVGDLLGGIWDGFTDAASNAIGIVSDLISDLIDIIPDVGGILDTVGGLGGKAKDLLFASGGIASGPTSGYTATLHGTEAVVPLPDGASIPVTLNSLGGGGGDTMNLSISVSGGGNARDIAKEVSKEVQRAFRTRSRGGGFGRGVI